MGIKDHKALVNPNLVNLKLILINYEYPTTTV